MHGTGVPLVTPFDADGEIDESKLRGMVEWVTERGVDFVVPCGSTSEAELMTTEERARVTEVVADAADVPVLAGTGHPGLAQTRRQTDLAARAGADAALVVTPFYYNHDADTLAAYYRDLADGSDIPVYLYSVPVFTGVALPPGTVSDLATHPNVHGMKDSSGDLTAFQRERAAASASEFDLLVGSGSIYAPALDAGADGGVLALANVAPAAASEVYRLHEAGETEAARRRNRELVELDTAVTARYGIPGLKAALRMRGAPAGHARSPFRPVGDDAAGELEDLLAVLD
ncbi:dihydrodipicolinate synthase family protein [Halobacteriales archaeon QS_1_68_17]|nr:MAG: dihydrodipicolinate synthase family protein [Halobacteriales archaeon QS_1_68_17]